MHELLHICAVNLPGAQHAGKLTSRRMARRLHPLHGSMRPHARVKRRGKAWVTVSHCSADWSTGACLMEHPDEKIGVAAKDSPPAKATSWLRKG